MAGCGTLKVPLRCKTMDQTLRDAVRARLEVALTSAQTTGRLPASDQQPAIEVVRPNTPEHGDFATNLALQLARPLRRAPREIAQALVDQLTTPTEPAVDGLLARAEVAGPGFVNVWLSPARVEQGVDAIRRAGPAYGRAPINGTRKINVEFVSANPTGPLHIGNARGAFVGDLLCRVLEAVGHEVTREYYFNDSGTQVRLLGESVLATRLGRPLPEDGYRGAYVADLAAELPPELAAQAEADAGEAAWAVGQWASDRVRGGIEASLQRLGVHFDVWKSEATLHADGSVARAIERLRESGHMYEQDGALWFRSTDFGDD